MRANNLLPDAEIEACARRRHGPSQVGSCLGTHASTLESRLFQLSLLSGIQMIFWQSLERSFSEVDGGAVGHLLQLLDPREVLQLHALAVPLPPVEPCLGFALRLLLPEHSGAVRTVFT